jgi:hypothetical protein
VLNKNRDLQKMRASAYRCDKVLSGLRKTQIIPTPCRKEERTARRLRTEKTVLPRFSHQVTAILATNFTWMSFMFASSVPVCSICR